MLEFSELRSTGVLWYLNRVALHPHGLALALHYEDNADPEVDEPIGWSFVVSDDGIWCYDETADDEGRAKYSQFLEVLQYDS